jgi:hypothetical protein
MSLLYGLVGYERKPLAEYDAGSGGNYRQVARELLGTMGFDGRRSAFEEGNWIFSCFSETTKLSVIVLSDKSVDSASRFYAVDQIRNKFVGKYMSTYTSAGELSKSSEFGPEIQRVFDAAVSPSTAKNAQINANMEATKTVMTDNLAKALARGEKLEVMEQKSENIKGSAAAFQRDASNLKRAMCWQKYKWYILIGIVVIVVILIIIIIAVSVS